MDGDDMWIEFVTESKEESELSISAHQVQCDQLPCVPAAMP